MPLLILAICLFADNGRVVHQSGTPLVSALVRIFDTKAGTLSAEFETEGDGRFPLPDLPPGDYRIDVSKPNYARASVRLHLPQPDLTIRLTKLGVITGRIVDLQDRPVPGAYVYTLPKKAAGSRVDDRGQYRLYSLEPGDYTLAVAYGASTVQVGSTGHANVVAALGSGVMLFPRSDQPRTFTIRDGEEFRNIDFVLTPGSLHRVTGRVSPVPEHANYWLAIADRTVPTLALAVAQTAPDGTFRFEGIPPGSYALTASGPSTARNSAGGILQPDPRFARVSLEVRGDIDDLTLEVRPGRTAKVRLEPGPGCPRAATVTLAPREDWAAQLTQTVALSAENPTLVTALAPVEYSIAATRAGNCFTSAIALDAEAVVALVPGGSVRGHVVGSVLQIDDGPDSVVPAADGTFLIPNLSPGPHSLTLRRPGQPARRHDFQVRSGETTEVNIQETP